ncbi:MAG: AMP-binding protein, partial [Candidatus Thiodiazotropha taylori]
MAALLHELIFESAIDRPEQPALQYKSSLLNYAQLERQLRLFAGSLQTIGIEPSDRVAIYLPKCLENVIAIFGALAAAAVFVPINPVLKPHQVLHILKDCDARLLITTCGKYRALVDDLDEAVDLNNLVVIDDCDIGEATPGVQHLFSWDGFMHLDQPQGLPQ